MDRNDEENGNESVNKPMLYVGEYSANANGTSSENAIDSKRHY